jgi:hypothetical protein
MLRRNGERSRRQAALQQGAPAVELHRLGDVLGLVSETITEVRRGGLDCKPANCVLYGASIAARVISDDIEKRVEVLEETVRQLQAAAVTRNGHAAPRAVEPVG